MQYFHMRPHTAPPSPFMPGLARSSGWGALPLPWTLVLLPVRGWLLSWALSGHFLLHDDERQKVQRQGEGKALTPPGHCRRYPWLASAAAGGLELQTLATERPSHSTPRGFSTTLRLPPAKRQEWQRARGAVSHWGGTEGASTVRESGGSGSPEPCESRGQGGTGEAILREGGCGDEGGPTSSTSPQRPKPNTAPWLQPCPQD